MSSHNAAQQYLAPPEQGFWDWSQDGEVIEFAGGGTIVFRAQLRKIIQRLGADALPPLDALLILLAACREDWRGSPSHLGRFAALLAEAMQTPHFVWLRDLAWKLDAVSCLPHDRRASTEAKITLARAIFQHTVVPVPKAEFERIFELLDGNSIKLFRNQSGDRSEFPWRADFNLLSRCIDAFDLNRLEEFERSGTELLPEPAEIEEPEFSSVRDLLGAIENDEELAGLARHVMAGLTLPKPLTEPDEIPVGGVSDISNRGPFDRLLVSELANDADVLMTRVALNEALYLRREAPPKSPPEQRIVIFDAGIRMWGVPRLFGTAVGLALGATADKASEVKFLRAEGDQLGEVPLENREHLIEHLEILRHEAHVGDALSRIAQLADDARGESAMILVTARDAASDPEFQKQLAEAGLTGLHIATVNRQGDFELFDRTSHGEKQFAAQKLSIDEILEPPAKSPDRPASASLLRPEYDPELPAILSVDPFPFRLPHGLKRGRAWLLPGGQVAAITPDGRLMLWDEKDVAARQLSHCLPPGEVIYRGSDSSGGIRAIVRGRKGVFLISGESGQVTSQWLAAKSLKVQTACEHNGRLMLITRGEVESFNPHSGDFLQSTRIPNGFKWRNDRFFTSNGTLHALSHTGLSPHFEQVFPDDYRVSCTGGFDSHGHGGPVGVTLGGAFVTWDRKTILTSSHLSVPPPLRVADVSFDGAVVVGESTRTSGKATVQVSQSGVEFHTAPVWASPPHSWVSQRSVRTRFREFSIRPGPRLCFWNKAGTVWEIVHHSTSGLMRVQRSFRNDSRRQAIFDDLRPCLLPGNRRFQLRVSTSSDGSRIYVDARGLIHLRSSNIDIPELSLVILDDGELACWSSDGTLVGPKYLVSGRGEVDRSEAGREAALAIRDHLNRFLDHCVGHSA